MTNLIERIEKIHDKIPYFRPEHIAQSFITPEYFLIGVYLAYEEPVHEFLSELTSIASMMIEARLLKYNPMKNE